LKREEREEWFSLFFIFSKKGLVCINSGGGAATQEWPATAPNNWRNEDLEGRGARHFCSERERESFAVVFVGETVFTLKCFFKTSPTLHTCTKPVQLIP